MRTVENPVSTGQTDPGEKSEQPTLRLEEIFSQVDTDNSGFIEFEEFAGWWNNKQMQTRSKVDEDALGKMMDLFQSFNTDHNQGLGLQEFSQLMNQVASLDWHERVDASSGRYYYAHPQSRQTRWQAPSVEEFLRDQGIVHAPAVDSVDMAGLDADGASDVHMVLNLWKIFLKTSARQRTAHYKDFFMYVTYTFISFLVVLGNMPSSTSFLVHQEALTDLLLDEEFGVVENHKKSWYDVMTDGEMWQWADGPLTEAFYGGDAALTDEPGPGPLLWSNRLIGGIQLRQMRVRPIKCPDTKWSMSPSEQQVAACSATWSPHREAKFTQSPARTPTDQKVSTTEYSPKFGNWFDSPAPVDESGLWWDNGAEFESSEWANASAWYADWGHSWLIEPLDGLSSSPALVQSFIGHTKANKYGDHGYAVVLPRQGRDFVEQIRQLKGEYVCSTAGSIPVTGQYHTTDTEDERAAAGDDGCATESDCPTSRLRCVSECPAGLVCTWRQKPAFVDQYTRMFAVTFNMHNSNDFDGDDYDPTEKSWANMDRMDDHLALAQIVFAFHPSGHIEKYERISIVRPMRTFGYLDTPGNQAGALVMVVMAFGLFWTEVTTMRKIGPKSYFVESENNIWNVFEIAFFYRFVRMVLETNTFYGQCIDMEAELAAARTDGTIDSRYIDIFELKSSFRSMMKSVSFLVFMSILKLFKYMNFSDNLNFMFVVVSRAKTKLLGFMFVYSLLIVCFAFLASTLFGYEMREFHNLASAIMSLVRLSVGLLDFDYNTMKTAEAFWAPLFLATFVFVAMLTIVNLFISILSDFYDQVNEETNTWNDDIKIFESQGMTVPKTDFVGNLFKMWDQMWLKFTLMIEVDPPHVPNSVRPVSKLVGPTWGEGDLKDVTCYPNFFDNASNLIRLHYFSEFVPEELENARGKKRANIPILGQISEAKGFHAHCVGLGNSDSPINELISEFGKLWEEDRWECTHCKHEFSAETDGNGKTLEEIHDDLPSHEVGKRHGWPCPNCQRSEPKKSWSDEQCREIFDHVNMLSSFGRCLVQPQQQTVACLKLHPDDMQSEVRPQVLAKMKARYTTVQHDEKKLGDLDVDYLHPLNKEPDTLDLMEDEFGARLQLECLLHETLEEDVRANGRHVGKARDSFVLFRVVQMSSHDHFAQQPTKLNKAEGMWKKSHDQILWDNETNNSQTPQSNLQMAEKVGRSEREVTLRRRFLKRLHRDDDGYPVTPKQLRIAFQPDAGTTLRMWKEAIVDPDTKAVSCSYACNIFKNNFCRCSMYRDSHYKDMKRFIRKQIQYIKDNSNSKDLTEMEEKFLRENMSLSEAIVRMKVHLVNSGKRSPKRMKEMYGARVGAKHEVDGKAFDENGKQVTKKMTVEEKLRRWLMAKYADEIDCVIIKHDEYDEDEDGEASVDDFHQNGLDIDDAEMRRHEVNSMRRSMSQRPFEVEGADI